MWKRGMCSCDYWDIKKNMVAPVKVNFQLGSLLIDYKKESNLIVAEGSATLVEKRQIEI